MKRFEFGKNWTAFAEQALSEERVQHAREDFRALVGCGTLEGQSFLDIGFGQGLAVALAIEEGAGRVVAIDIDPDCLNAYEITKRHFPALARTPHVIVGSILDNTVVAKLKSEGPFDIVHSWGVLHHTGRMWDAIDHAASLVKPGGQFILAIYARHWTSPLWRTLKWTYVSLPTWGKRLMLALFYPAMRLRAAQLKDPADKQRGMNFYHDLVDWVGGYPYEYASKDEIEKWLNRSGFRLVRFRSTKGWTGCHEYVFSKISEKDRPIQETVQRAAE